MTRYKVRYCALAVPAHLRLPEDVRAALQAACAERCGPRTRALAGRLVEVIYASKGSGLCVIRVAHEIFHDVQKNALSFLGAYLPGARGSEHSGEGDRWTASDAVAGQARFTSPMSASSVANAPPRVRVIAVSGSMLQLSKRLCPILQKR